MMASLDRAPYEAVMTDSPPAPLVIAGATGYGVWPSNSLEGALKCLAEPIDGIEIDVQMTADGHVVAHHDYHLSRHATRLDGAWLEARGPTLKTLTLAELERYDVGSLRPGSDYAARYPDRAPADGVRIPTMPRLLQALRDAGGPRRLIYIEIKTDPQDPDASPDPGRVTEAVIAAVEAADWVAHSKIIAFDWRVLRLSHERNPAIATAHLTIPAGLASGVKPLPNGDSPWTDGCDPRGHGRSDLAAIKAHGGMEWSPYFTDVTPERMDEARDLGLRVGPWGLSAAEDVDRMLDLGVWSATVSGPAWGRGRFAT
jgi:glycerophosphoryl diester phosphodiesterase